VTTLRSSLKKPVLAHVVLWYGKDGPSETGFNSGDPNVIGDQLDSIQNFCGEGAGVIALSFGATVSTFIHQASMEMCRQANERQMPFALCFDPWSVSPSKTLADIDSTMVKTLQHPDIQTMLNSRSYLTAKNGKKAVLDFSTGADKAVVSAAVPGVDYWCKNEEYSWPEIVETVPTLAVVQALPTMQLPSVCVAFDDGTGPDRNKSRWNQSQPVRILPPREGSLFWDMADLASECKGAQFIQLVTWNDYHEQTAVAHVAAMLRRRIGPKP
jgi:hypothetical protein